jgi:hypothetical protein
MPSKQRKAIFKILDHENNHGGIILCKNFHTKKKKQKQNKKTKQTNKQKFKIRIENSTPQKK